VIIVNMSYPNYVCVRVRFPLANALVASMKVCIKGRGDIVVPIWYENVPFFCFFCGRIDHSDKECPDGEIGVGEVKFGVELRASLKRIHEVRIPVRREAARFLNFEGSQRTKLQDEASSSQVSGQGYRRAGQRVSTGEVGCDVESARSIPIDDERELMRGVKEIDMRDADMNQGLQPVFGSDELRQRVSFGTNATSKEEMSTGVSNMHAAMHIPPMGGTESDSHVVEQDLHRIKRSGPNRSGDNLKGERLFPYRRPQRKVTGASLEGAAEANTAREIKEEGVGMEDQVFGNTTLALILTDPKTVMGPRLGARQEP
jgi:hypothetical protein